MIGCRALASSALVLTLASCGRDQDPRSRPVAELGGRALTVAELDAYLDANLAPSGETGSVGGEADDEVKSRLLDNFVDEEILLAEAERRGIRPTDGEVDAYLGADLDEGSGAAAHEAGRREAARRNVTIQKLREDSLRDRVTVSEAETDAYVAAHRDDLTAGRRVLLRSIRFASRVEAEAERRKIAPHPGRAGVEQDDDAEAFEVDLSSLPPEVRAAVAALHENEVSAPVEVAGGVFLFVVEGWVTPVDGESELRERARQELVRARYEEESRKLLEELRKPAQPRLRPENLPFRYVPETVNR